MKKKLLACFIITVVSFRAFAQSETYSNVNSVILEELNNGLHFEITEPNKEPYFVTRDEYIANSLLKITLDTSSEAQFREENVATFSIHDFQDISKKKLLKKLKNKVFYYFENRELQIMTIVNEHLFAVHRYYYFDKYEDLSILKHKFENVDFEYIDWGNEKMKYCCSSFFAYSNFTINESTVIFANDDFTLLPLKKGIKITYEKRDWQPFSKKNFKLPKKRSTYNGNIRRLYHIEKCNNKFKISDFRFQKTYLSDLDSIIIGNNYIFIKKNNLFQVCDIFLKPYKHTPALRAVFSDAEITYGIQVLVGNEIKWLFKDGKCSPKQRKRIYYKTENCLLISTYQNQDSRKYGTFEGYLYKFKQNNLWGYYPLMTESKFQNLEDFKFYFARFKTPNGKEGWLDKNGKVYFDE